MPGFAENALMIAKAGIYDLRSHLDDVVRSVLRSGECSSATISTAKELACEMIWRRFLDLVEAKASLLTSGAPRTTGRCQARRRSLSLP